MPAEIPNIIILIGYEFFILFSSVRLTYLITLKYEKKFPILELLIAWISFSLVFNFVIPSIFSFLQFNGIIQYFIASLLIFSILHLIKKSDLKIYWDFLSSTLKNISANLLEWKVLFIILAILPFVLFSVRPTSNTDSLFMLDFIIDWNLNQNDPYTRAWYFVPLWDLSYLPHLTISNSDNFFWLNSFKPLIIIGLGTYLIGREIKMPSHLIWISLLASLLFFKIWLYGSNMGTLKNDYIFAAGFVLVIYSLIRSSRTNYDNLINVLFIIGLIFLSIKYTGILLGLISISVFIFINRYRIIENKKKMVTWGAVFLIIFFSLPGNYYLFNLIEFENPFHPVGIGFLGFEFPGRDLSSTTILANLDKEEVRNVFFPTSHFSRGGIFFPILMAFGFVGTLGIFFYFLFRFFKTKNNLQTLLIISFFLFLTWNLFLITPFTAGQVGGLEFWVDSELRSTRYIIGTIFITELFFVYLLWKLNTPKILIYSFFGINILSRYWILFTGIPRWFDYSMLIIPFLILIGLFLLGKFSRNFQHKILVLTVLCISGLIISPSMVESNRAGWIPWWQDVVFYIHELPPSEIFLIKEPERGNDIRARTYPVYGTNFQHIVKIGTQSELEEMLEGQYEPPEFVVKLCKPKLQCDSIIEKLEMDIKPYGYEMAAIDRNAILLKYIG